MLGVTVYDEVRQGAAVPDPSFGAAYQGLFRSAYRVAYRLLGSRHDAEEVAQEALTRALARWRSVRGHGEAWVVRVASNLAIDRTRRARRVSPAPPGVTTADDPYREDRIDLRRALNQLPRRQREVVVLRYLADLPQEEVAAALGLSIGTVKSHAARGLEALRGLMRER